MPGSIIEQTVEKEKKRRIKELKKKREQQRLERERREREEFEKSGKVKPPKRSGVRLPKFKSKVKDAIEKKEDQRETHDTLPDSMLKKRPKKPTPESVWGGGSTVSPPQPQQETLSDPQTQPSPPQQVPQPQVDQQPDQPIPEHKIPSTPVQQPQQQMAQQQQPQMMQQAPPNLAQLIDKSTKDQLMDYFSGIIRSSTITYLPGIDQGKFKFPDYGYKRLIELLIESKDFLRIFIDLEDIQGVTFVKISQFIRPMDNPADEGDDKVLGAENSVRGIEALCDILYNGEVEMDPYENEWKHLNKVLDCFSQPEIKGRQRSWKIETEKAVLEMNSNNTGAGIEYKAKIGSK